MATTPRTEEPGFEADVDELPKDRDNGAADTLEDDPQTENEDGRNMEEVQKEAAEERKEGGYQ